MEQPRLSRRVALTALAGVGIAAFWLRRASRGSVGLSRALSPHERATLEQAQERLLPSDAAGPGAEDVRAIGYLDRVLQDPRTPVKEAFFFRKGVATLDRRARKIGVTNFIALPGNSQDATLRDFATTPEGRWWMQTLLAYTLEAFLGDPTHGANPQGAVWAWAEHRPGWPRPERAGWQPREHTP